MALSYTVSQTGIINNALATTTSASVSVAVNDVVYVMIVFESGPTDGQDAATAITNSGTGLTWSKIGDTTPAADGGESRCALYRAISSVSQSMTVTHNKTSSGTIYRNMTVVVVTGADTADPEGTINVQAAASSTLSSTITPVGVGSLLFMIMGDWGQTNSYAALTGCTVTKYNQASAYTSAFIEPTTNPLASGSAFTIGASGTGSVHTWIAFEVLPFVGPSVGSSSGIATVTGDGDLISTNPVGLASGSAFVSAVGFFSGPIYTPSVALSTNDDNGQINFRQLVQLSSNSAGKLRVRLKGGISNQCIVGGASFGKWNGVALSSSSCDMTASPIRITFSGSNGVTIPNGGATVTSDWISHPGLTLNSGDWVIVAWWCTTANPNSGQSYSTGHTTATTVFKSTATDYSQAQTSSVMGDGLAIVGSVQPGGSGGYNFCLDRVETLDDQVEITGVGAVTGTGTALAVGIANTAGVVLVPDGDVSTGSWTSSLGSSFTWNPSSKSADITLSGGNLTATGSASNDSNVRGTIAPTTGKYYWEILFTATASDYFGLGLTNINAGLDTWMGSAANDGFATYGSITSWDQGGGSSGAAPGWTSGDRIGCAWDVDAERFWITKNGTTWYGATSAGNPAAGTGGYDYSGINPGPYYPTIQLGTSNMAALKPDSADWTYTAPSGFGPLGVSLYGAVDDDPNAIDDNDYIQSSVSPVSDVCRINLSNPSTGITNDVHVVYRYRGTVAGVLNLRVRLMEGSNVISTWNHSAIGSSFTTTTQTLTAPETASIIDAGNLSVEFSANTP